MQIVVIVYHFKLTLNCIVLTEAYYCFWIVNCTMTMAVAARVEKEEAPKRPVQYFSLVFGRLRFSALFNLSSTVRVIHNVVVHYTTELN